MLRISVSLLLLSIFTCNAHASSVLPQEVSTGTDGSFNLLSDDILFNNADGIYNFIDFNIADGATLNINSSGPVYIYSQQSMTIFGNLIADTTDLHLIAPTINTGSTSTISADSITLVILDSSGTGTGSTDTGNGIIIDSGNSGITTVPVPAAIWLMLSGMLVLFRFKTK